MNNYLGIQTGDIIFTRERGFINWLIRFGTRSPVNHVAIVTEVAKHGVRVAEAMPEGFLKSGYENDYILTNGEVRRYFDTLAQSKRDKLRSAVYRKLGKPYDWKAIKRIAIRILTLGLYRSRLDTPEALICSEAVARILQHMGADISKTEHITPEELRQKIPTVIVPLRT